jgi:hypothetical protein
MGFHAPMHLADTLLKSQKFDAALECCHYVFDPYAGGTAANRAWKWQPFKNVKAENVITAVFNSLEPNKPEPNKQDSINAINVWRKKPFAPHVVARGRPMAYMTWAVMKYLEILTAYGDWYFRQGSLESLQQALQLYVVAKHIFGPKPQAIPRAGSRRPETYFSLLQKWDAFSNASVDMELAFPFSNQTDKLAELHGLDMTLTNIFGFAKTSYFSIPENSKLRDMRDLLDSRIYNIRNCLDINGKSASYPLWDPPIDPAVLVSAVAQGLSLSSVVNDLSSPMPNYRFFYLLQKAIELCGELKTSSNMFLSIRERRDGEALSLMRSRQELEVNNLVLALRKMQLEESNSFLDALRESRKGPLARYAHYTSLIGKSDASLAESDAEYKEIELQIPVPNTVGDLTLTGEEKQELEEAKRAKRVNDAVAREEVMAGFLASFPSLQLCSLPLGLGIMLQINPSLAVQAHARVLRANADTHSFNSSESVKRAGYAKQHQERVQQANSTGYELM